MSMHSRQLYRTESPHSARTAQGLHGHDVSIATCCLIHKRIQHMSYVSCQGHALAALICGIGLARGKSSPHKFANMSMRACPRRAALDTGLA